MLSQLRVLLPELQMPAAELVEMRILQGIQRPAQIRLLGKLWALPGGGQDRFRAQARVHLGQTSTARQDSH